MAEFPHGTIEVTNNRTHHDITLPWPGSKASQFKISQFKRDFHIKTNKIEHFLVEVFIYKPTILETRFVSTMLSA